MNNSWYYDIEHLAAIYNHFVRRTNLSVIKRDFKILVFLGCGAFKRRVDIKSGIRAKKH